MSDTGEYVRRVTAGEDPADYREHVDARTRRAEQLAFALRTSAGIDETNDEVHRLHAAGYLAPHGARWVLTRSGKMVADAIAETFVG